MAVRTANRSRAPRPGHTRPGRDRASHGGRASHLRVRPGAGHLPRPVLPALRCAGREVGSVDVRPATLAAAGGLIHMIESAPMFGVLAGSLAVACTVPYVRDTLRGTTVPHRGSWLIWSVLEVVAVEAQRADGARWSLVPLVTQTVGTCLVFALAVWLGSGGLSRVDRCAARARRRRRRGVAGGRRARHRHRLRDRGRPRSDADDGAQDVARPTLGDAVDLRARSRVRRSGAGSGGIPVGAAPRLSRLLRRGQCRRVGTDRPPARRPHAPRRASRLSRRQPSRSRSDVDAEQSREGLTRFARAATRRGMVNNA